MLFGAAGQSFAMVMLAISNAYIDISAWAVCAAVFLFVFNSFFAVGWLGMTWLYPVSKSASVALPRMIGVPSLAG